jgi:hypothetical protein
LYYQREGNAEHPLIAISESRFCFEAIEYFILEVETDAAGNPVALVGHYRGGRTDRSERSGE